MSGAQRASSTALVLGGIFSVQLGAATATSLFDELGPAGTVFLRVLFAAAMLLAVWRPRLAGTDRDGLWLVALFGVALAGMNLCFYEAIDRIPLGIAVTFEFVGPLGVAILASRRAVDSPGRGWPPSGSRCYRPGPGLRSTRSASCSR